ncbi:hypothetical protein GCM10027430_35910 [Lysobacter tyrosinilyticus]
MAGMTKNRFSTKKPDLNSDDVIVPVATPRTGIALPMSNAARVVPTSKRFRVFMEVRGRERNRKGSSSSCKAATGVRQASKRTGSNAKYGDELSRPPNA